MCSTRVGRRIRARRSCPAAHTRLQRQRNKQYVVAKMVHVHPVEVQLRIVLQQVAREDHSTVGNGHVHGPVSLGLPLRLQARARERPQTEARRPIVRMQARLQLAPADVRPVAAHPAVALPVSHLEERWHRASVQRRGDPAKDRRGHLQKLRSALCVAFRKVERQRLEVCSTCRGAGC